MIDNPPTLGVPFGYTAGDFILPPGLGVWTGGTPSVSAHVVAWPFYFPQPQAIDRAGVQLTTAQAGAAAWVAAYNNTGGGRPGTLIGDWGGLDLSTGSGNILATISTVLVGRVWVLVWLGAANPQATVSVRSTFAGVLPHAGLAATTGMLALFTASAIPTVTAPTTAPTFTPGTTGGTIVPQLRAA